MYFLCFSYFLIWFSHGSLMEISSTHVYFRNRTIMLCLDDEKQKDKSTFKDNSQSEYFIYWCHCLLLKFLCSGFKNLRAHRFIWRHIPHTNRIKKFSNYQGKTWECSMVVPNFLATMAKRGVQWSKAKINSSFLAAIMENRFHRLFILSFIKILTEVLI